MRVDTASLISGAVVCGDRGLGVLGSVILSDTATGDFGPGYLYNDVDPGDEGKEFRGLIVTPPSAGTFFAYEDGSFSLVAPDGAYTFVYRLYVDGTDLGTATANVTVGGAGAEVSLATTTDTTVFAGSVTVSPVAALSVTTADSVFSGSASQATAGGLAALDITTDDSTFVGLAVIGALAEMAISTDPVALSMLASVAVWPGVGQVLAGTVYGPTGVEYTGTLSGGSSPSAAQIAAEVLAQSQLTPIWADVKKVNSFNVAGEGRPGNAWGPA